MIFAALLTLIPFAIALADGGHGDEGASTAAGSAAATPLTVIVSVIFLLGAIFLATDGKLNRNGLMIAVLSTITAAIHLFFGLNGETLLILNGVGYFALAAALIAPHSAFIANRKWICYLLIAYTLVTIIAYFVTHTPAQMSGIGIFDKIIEVILIGTLIKSARS